MFSPSDHSSNYYPPTHYCYYSLSYSSAVGKDCDDNSFLHLTQNYSWDSARFYYSQVPSCEYTTGFNSSSFEGASSFLYNPDWVWYLCWLILMNCMLISMLRHLQLFSAIILACLAGRIKSLLRWVNFMIRLSLHGCCSANLVVPIFSSPAMLYL